MNITTLGQCDYRIYIGRKERNTGIVHRLNEVHAVCQKYVNLKGECVFVKEGKFIYTNGGEVGCEILFIQYPRFPKEHDEIRDRAIELAKMLLIKMNQLKAMVIGNGDSIMISNTKLEKEWINC